MDHSQAISFFAQSSNSRSQEKFAEYFFLKDLILQAAQINEHITISRSDFDAFGFDVLLGWKDSFILVQIKSYTGAAASWDVHKSLLNNPDGRIVLIKLSIKERVIIIDDARVTERIIVPEYSLFDRCNDKVLESKPLVSHHGKCRTNKGEYLNITDNLLSIFDK